MNTPKFTPGPWAYHNGSIWSQSPAVDKSKRTNAVCLASDKLRMPDSERLANVRAIAALPDLYAALEAINHHLTAWHDDAVGKLHRCVPHDEPSYRNLRDNYATLLDLAEATLKKARGEA